MRAIEDRRPRERSARGGWWACSPLRPYALAALVLAIVVVADQLSKRAVEHSIVPGEERGVFPGVQFVNTLVVNDLIHG